MKQLLAVFLIGISCFVYSCAGKEISPSQETTAQPAETADAHYNLGVAYVQQGKYDLAVESYQKAIVSNPNNAMAHYSLGFFAYPLEKVH